MTSVQPATPPWQLSGAGHAIVLSCSQSFAASCAAHLSSLAGRARGGPGALMFIDYSDSAVGPYRELLLCPGMFDMDGQRSAVVTHCWVSSMASAINGRRNWGLPKRVACFESLEQTDARETFRIALPDCPPLTLSFRRYGLRLPMTTSALPRAWRTLVQPWKGHCHRTCIHARGRVCSASLDACRFPPSCGFPDIAGQRRRFGMHAERFQLEFPRAQRTPIRK